MTQQSTSMPVHLLNVKLPLQFSHGEICYHTQSEQEPKTSVHAGLSLPVSLGTRGTCSEGFQNVLVLSSMPSLGYDQPSVDDLWDVNPGRPQIYNPLWQEGH